MLHGLMMDTPTARDDDEDAPDEVVARYVASRSGDASADLRMEFMRWSAEKPQHRQGVSELQRLDADLDALRDHYAAETGALAQPARRRTARWLRGLAAACVAVLALIFLSSGTRTVVASGGVPAQLTLWDGSRIHLDAGARVEIPYAPWSRRIALDGGDALFEVVHDDWRPFSATVGQVVIRDLGTRFLIQAGKDGVRVAVYEGAVEIDSGTGIPPYGLAAQQAVAVSADGKARSIPLPDEARATAWSRGRLVFDNTPLAEVSERLSRYWGDKVELGSPAIAGLRVTGAFEMNNRAGLLRALELTLPVAVRKNGSDIVLIQAPPREVIAPRLLLP